MNQMRKGQIEKVEKGTVRKRIKFMHQIFGVAAEFSSLLLESSVLLKFLQHN